MQGCTVKIGAYFELDQSDIPCNPHPLPQAVVTWTSSNNVDDAICGTWLTDNNWRTTISISLAASLDGIDDGQQIRTLSVYEIHYNDDDDDMAIYEKNIGSVEVCVTKYILFASTA